MFKIKVLADSILGKDSSWFIDGCLLAVSSRGEERETALVSLPLIRTLILWIRPHPYNFI